MRVGAAALNSDSAAAFAHIIDSRYSSPAPSTTDGRSLISPVSSAETHWSSSPRLPLRETSASRISAASGSEATTSIIGASIIASSTENNPSVNSSAPPAIPSASPASSQKRARISAVIVSSVGLSSMLASTLSVDQRLTLSSPSSASA